MGFMYLMQNFQTERLIACVSACAGLQLAMDGAIAYGRDRKAFGKPIIKREYWQHKFVDLHAKLEGGQGAHLQGRRDVQRGALREEGAALDGDREAHQHGEDLRRRARHRGHGPVPAVPRRLGLHRGVPHRARVARSAPPPHRRRHDRDDALLRREADGVVHNGQLAWAKGYGARAVGGAPVTTETLFEAAPSRSASRSPTWPR